MNVIERFMERYRREVDYFDQAARLVYEQLDAALASSGVRAMVTYRAKRPERLEQKIRQRARTKNYRQTKDIYDDIVDFAGVRVALYFPGARGEVEKIIRARFDLVEEPKVFPTGQNPTYEKRFSGYWATHYRLRLREGNLLDGQKRYADARVEVQVASVLMHAWSEVEHDLVYKPLQGQLSEDEYAILDELNGLVLAGEIALERLQRAMQARVARDGTPFGNHFELAAFLLKAAAPLLKGGAHESALGRVDALFDLLTRLELSTPERIQPFLGALHADTDRRSIADQIVDQVVATDESRYRLYSEIRHRYDTKDGHGRSSARRRSEQEALGTFLTNWIALDRRLGRARRVKGLEGPEVLADRRVLERYLELDPEVRREIDRIRMLRNNVVHGEAEPDAAVLREATATLKRILAHLDGPDGVGTAPAA
jgi:ppGpp synthetase/RelA/SpoT-type nucleotidyltranferase